MSILGDLFAKILRHKNQVPPASPGGGASPGTSASRGPALGTTPPSAANAATGASAPPTPGAPAAGAEGTSGASTSGRPSAPATSARLDDVDVTALLDQLASRSSQKLDWRHSIVDMMKLLGIDSSLAARRQLAQELGYSGDPSDSAKMNLWLHEQVLRKLADNGGKVPQDLLH